MKKKKLIIWDFDGPIIDSRELALELTQFHHHDVTEDVHRNLFNGNIFAELLKLKKKNVGEEEHTEFLEKSYWPRKMKLEPISGINKVIEELSHDFIMVVNSSSEKHFISSYFEKNNLEKFFSRIYAKEIESKEEKFRIILKDFKVLPKDCILITDTLGDVLEAKTIMIPSIVVLWGYQLKSHFNSVEKDLVFVNNPIELKNKIIDHFSKLE